MKYISAQPDSPYFLWQLQVQVSNFRSLGIEKDYIIVVGTKGKEPSPEFRRFADQTDASVVFIEDKREQFYYIPSIRPHILKSIDIWDQYDVMYQDSDILLNRRLNLSGDKVLVSDAKSYIGAKYIEGKSTELFERMCDLVEIDPDLVRSKEESSGGAQYWFPKGKIPLLFWYKVEADSVNLYKLMKETESIYSPHHPIQAWTADMWAVLWNIWLHGVETEISSELDFCWAMDSIETIERKPIFHLAGITEKDMNKHFFKGAYMNKSPLGAKINSVDGLCYNRYIEEIRRAEQIFT